MDRKQHTSIPGRWLAIALLVAYYSARAAAPKPPPPEIIHEPASPRPGHDCPHLDESSRRHH
jgi:hypothetical protein